MKKIIVSIILLLSVTQSAFADTCSKSLTGLFNSYQATKLCSTFIGTGSATTVAGNLVFSAAAAKIIPGATSLTFRNNADNASNIAITDAGAVTIRSALTVNAGGLSVNAGGIASSGNLTNTSGDVILSTSGNTISVQEATASTACMGVATPNGTTNVTVTTSCAVSGARVFYTRVGAVTNMGPISTTTNPNGTNFTFASTSGTDTLASSVVYLIVKESA